MGKESLILWLNMMFPLVFSIGPMNVMFASYGGKFGFRRTIPFMIGCDVVTFLLSLMIGYGGLKLIQQHSVLFGYLKYAGAAYLVYLAYKCFRSKPYMEEVKQEVSDRPTFIDGAVLNLLNIKAIMLISIMFTSFLDITNEAENNVLLLSGLLLVLALSCHSVWIYCGSWLSKRFASKSFFRAQNYAFSGMLLFVAMWILL
jgi:threonine/homoserine/homoserine lactone efflux protein